MQRYLRLLRAGVRHRWLTVGAALAFCVLSVVGLATMSRTFMPPDDFSSSQVMIELPPGVRLADTARVSEQVTRILRQHKEVTNIVEAIGSDEDGQVRIEIRDDGRGIDPQAVRAKALASRLKTEAELDRMSPRELMSLILLPGFSTARQVTEVSGRGVGMDVVKTNIELLEGSLAIDSVPGMGTAMVLRMPLTLAIIPCLIVTAAGERVVAFIPEGPYVIPKYASA